MTETEFIVENKLEIYDCNIAYCKYGYGPNYFIFICGGVGNF